MCSGIWMTTQTGNKGQIKVENILQPFDSWGRLICENLDQIRSRFVSGRFQSIVVELLDAVLDLKVNLSSGQSTVDAGCGFRRVATEKVWYMLAEDYAVARLELTVLVQQQYVATIEVDSMSCAEARD